jgi:rRNA-processing protein FCF1
MSQFEQKLQEAAEKSVLKIVSEGSWIAPDYANRFKIPHEMLAEIYGLIDRDRLKSKMAARLEDELAERVMNHIAAEVATDIKQILSVKERREALRNIAREHMDAILNPSKEPKE